MDERLCSLCKAPIARGRCPHVLIDGERVTMTFAEWQKLIATLSEYEGLLDGPDA